jgi:hypothetical protein
VNNFQEIDPVLRIYRDRVPSVEKSARNVLAKRSVGFKPLYLNQLGGTFGVPSRVTFVAA